jgi:hypothetical protein
LPTSATKLLALIRTRLGHGVVDTVDLRQFGYLLGTAPLTAATRSAAWQAIAALAGLRTCSAGAGASPQDTGLCLTSHGHTIELIAEPGTGAVQAVEDRIDSVQRAYPGIPAGALVESVSFQPAR